MSAKKSDEATSPDIEAPAEPDVVASAIGACSACGQPIQEGGIGSAGYTFHPDGGKDRTGVFVHNDCTLAAPPITKKGSKKTEQA